MDGLRERMKADWGSWNDRKFGFPASSFSVVEAHKSQGPLVRTTTTSRSVNARDLLQWFDAQPEGQVGVAWHFQLVRIRQSENSSLQIDRPTFEALIRLLRIDETALYMFKHHIYGIYHFKADSASTTPGAEPITSSFLSSVSGAAMWSHDRVSKRTRAIFIPRPQGNGVEDSSEIFRELESTIVHQSALIELPCFLQLVSAINLTAWIDSVVGSEGKRLRQVESFTRHGLWSRENDNRPPPPFRHMSEAMAKAVTALANAQRHADLVTDFLAAQELGQPLRAGPQAANQISEVKARELVEHLGARVAIRKREIEYLLQRVNIQLTVTFGLMTEEQTDASLDIAAAAKEDSEAMKVIAIMTMLFLPGTFFATCFAVPTLHWDDQNVISDRFWVYIAFSVPSTVLIGIFYVGWPTLNWRLRKYFVREAQ